MGRAVTANPNGGAPVNGNYEFCIVGLGCRKNGKNSDVRGEVGYVARRARRAGERIHRPVCLEQIDSVPWPDELDRVVIAQSDRRGDQPVRQSGSQIGADQASARDRLTIADRAGQPPSGQPGRVAPGRGRP